MPEQLNIYPPETINVSYTEPTSIRIINDDNYSIIRVIDAGPTGRPGDRGSDGSGISTEPFVAIITGSLYYTTASISFQSTISSSLIPYTGSNGITSFGLGSISNPWLNMFISTASSVNFVDAGEILATLSGGRNKISIGNTFLSTSSFGFDATPIIIRNSSTDARLYLTGSMEVIGDGSTSIIRIRSGSFESATIDSEGVLRLGQFEYMPAPRVGGLIFSGSNFYIAL